jgi:hypothetical protein
LIKPKVYKILVLICFFAFAKAISSCADDSRIKEEIAAIEVGFEVIPFHQIFSEANPADLDELKQTFPQFFPQRVPDSVWMGKMLGRDTIQNVLEEAVASSGPSTQMIAEQAKDVFKHVKYYFPDFEPMDVVTIISEVDYRYRMVASRDFLVIGIDNYLGRDHELYQGIYPYVAYDLDPENLSADMAGELAQLFVNQRQDRIFLDQLIAEGKVHFLQTKFAPQASKAAIFRFTPEKYVFVEANEDQIWRYFVDKELLYSSDPQLPNRFIRPAPFSKFYLEIDNRTPGGVARYIGYRIIEDFMQNNDVSLDEMLNLPAETILKESGYKPKN